MDCEDDVAPGLSTLPARLLPQRAPPELSILPARLLPQRAPPEQQHGGTHQLLLSALRLQPHLCLHLQCVREILEALDSHMGGAPFTFPPATWAVLRSRAGTAQLCGRAPAAPPRPPTQLQGEGACPCQYSALDLAAALAAAALHAGRSGAARLLRAARLALQGGAAGRAREWIFETLAEVAGRAAAAPEAAHYPMRPPSAARRTPQRLLLDAPSAARAPVPRAGVKRRCWAMDSDSEDEEAPQRLGCPWWQQEEVE